MEELKNIEAVFCQINLYAHSQEEYLLKREKQRFEAIEEAKKWIDNKKDLEVFIKDYDSSIFRVKNPCCYYNDIIGYADICFYNTDIRIRYYLKGDKRKKYNKKAALSMIPSKIYDRSYSQGDSLEYVKGEEEYTNKSIELILIQLIEELKQRCDEWKIYFDRESLLEKIQYFDFVGWLASVKRTQAMR